jgi:Ras-related protein Rab-1A
MAQVLAMKYDATFKLILIGDSGVGKSCIIKRVGEKSFNDDHKVTIGAEFTTIGVKIDKALLKTDKPVKSSSQS